jgi:carbonic anhydrase
MIASACFLTALVAAPPSSTHQRSTPKVDVLGALLEGNKRFAGGKPVHPHQDSNRRKAQAKGQAPRAIILGCADSRVSPELLFDQGIGDLFVVRAAGNVADVFSLASIEYAVQHLGSTHLMVLGHGKCGAVKAACDAHSAKAGEDHSHSAEPDPSSIGSLVVEILPGVKEASSKKGDLLANAIAANARRSLERVLERSPFLKHRVLMGKLTVSCAVYDLESGLVKVVDSPAISGVVVKVSNG